MFVCCLFFGAAASLQSLILVVGVPSDRELLEQDPPHLLAGVTVLNPQRTPGDRTPFSC